MDRIDLQVHVSRLQPEEITSHREGEASDRVRSRVEVARKIQQERFRQDEIGNINSNAQMQSRHLRHWCLLDDASRLMIEAAIRRLGLSARASDRILKVSRTIADLAGEPNIQITHVAEAIQYRTFDRMT